MEQTTTDGRVVRGLRARFYDIGNSFYGVPLINRKHTSLVHLRSGDRVLDIGCGTGRVIRRLLKRHDRGVRFWGVDPSSEMTEIASRRFRKRPSVSIEPGAGENLPYAAGSFDWIVSCLTTHHLPLDLKRAMVAECFRVLRPGGTLLISDFGPPKNAVGRLFARWWRSHAHSAENMEGVVADLVAEKGFVDLRTNVQAGIIEHLAAVRA